MCMCWRLHELLKPRAYLAARAGVPQLAADGNPQPFIFLLPMLALTAYQASCEEKEEPNKPSGPRRKYLLKENEPQILQCLL